MCRRSWDSDADTVSSCSSRPSSSHSSLDEVPETSRRLTPHWPTYRDILRRHGFALDTFRDVKEFYHNHWGTDRPRNDLPGYRRACQGVNEDDLCRDAGLPDNLFRGCSVRDKVKVVVKAVCLHSREWTIISFLSHPTQRKDPQNHCIPVLDLISVSYNDVGLIVMEEWSSQLITETPCCMKAFLNALRQCIEHIAFMHKHRIAQLDISLRNILTDYKGHYACIDYELSRRFDSDRIPRVHGARGTEIPPELEAGEYSDPFKVDVFALGVLLIRATKLTGFIIPGLKELVEPMLHKDHRQRPTVNQVLKAFLCMASRIPPELLKIDAPCHGNDLPKVG